MGKYRATGNSFAAKSILKKYGFWWQPFKKVWFREDGVFDTEGHTAEESVSLARKSIKESEIDCDIIYYDNGFSPESE